MLCLPSLINKITIKIITKLQNNHSWESPEAWLNQSPTTKEKPPQDWLRRRLESYSQSELGVQKLSNNLRQKPAPFTTSRYGAPYMLRHKAMLHLPSTNTPSNSDKTLKIKIKWIFPSLQTKKKKTTKKCVYILLSYLGSLSQGLDLAGLLAIVGC